MLIKEPVVKVVNHVVCDFCQQHMDWRKKCYGCQRDICSKCRVYYECDPWSGEFQGDYPTAICKECDLHLKPLLKESKDLREEFEAKIEKLENKWLEQCRKVEKTDTPTGGISPWSGEQGDGF